MAGAAVAAFVPAELCPDHFVAAGKLTQAELLTSGSFLGRLPNADGTVRLWDPANHPARRGSGPSALLGAGKTITGARRGQ